MDKKIPTGSLWIVLPFTPPSQRAYGYPFKPEGITGWRHPSPSYVNRINYLNDPCEEYAPGDMLLIGGTQTYVDRTEWVQVLAPRIGWVNRTHFNIGSDRLRRVS